MKRNRFLLSVAAAAASAVASFSAQAVTITFDTLTPGTVLSTQYASQGVSFSPNAFTGANGNSTSQDWATNTAMTIAALGTSEVGVVGTPSLASGNVLHGFSGWLGENGDPSFSVSFLVPITSFSLDFVGVGSGIEDTSAANAFADVALYFYSGATLLSTVRGPAPSSDNVAQFTLGYSAIGITRVVVAPGSYDDWVAVDNLTYVTAVPEPGTLPAMALGLAAIGFAGARAKRRAG